MCSSISGTAVAIGVLAGSDGLVAGVTGVLLIEGTVCAACHMRMIKQTLVKYYS